MRCDQCKHWKVNDDYIERWTGFGRCLSVRERWRIMEDATEGRELGWSDGEDGWDEYGDEPPPPNSWTGVRVAALREARAAVQDGSDYHAELVTAPDFYCALFASADTHPEGGDVKQAPSLMGSAVPSETSADAQVQPLEPKD